ncbi:hypothetical protein BDV97DRAFT_128826 [Delphinella strobiligena]|nr:hypothetical protein BDV97DRAFT_128826 [Delphinella strobiligena]
MFVCNCDQSVYWLRMHTDPCHFISPLEAATRLALERLIGRVTAWPDSQDMQCDLRQNTISVRIKDGEAGRAGRARHLLADQSEVKYICRSPLRYRNSTSVKGPHGAILRSPARAHRDPDVVRLPESSSTATLTFSMAARSYSFCNDVYQIIKPQYASTM